MRSNFLLVDRSTARSTGRGLLRSLNGDHVLANDLCSSSSPLRKNTPRILWIDLMSKSGGNEASTHVPWWLYALDKVRRVLVRPLAHTANIVSTDEHDSHVVDRRRCPLHAVGRCGVLRCERGALLRDGEDHQEVRTPAPPSGNA